MILKYYINLTLMSAFSILFFCSGLFLNTLVVLSFWRSAQLRKKTCHFMIMVLSCCDLLAVLVNNPLMAAIYILWVTEHVTDGAKWTFTALMLSDVSQIFPLFALQVMNLDRYLAISHPIFHRTKVTKGRLLTLLSTIILLALILGAMSVSIFPHHIYVLIMFAMFIPPMVFFNYKLFSVAMKTARNNAMSTENKHKFSLKAVWTCWLAVTCNVVLSIPVFVYIPLRMRSDKNAAYTWDDGNLVGNWAKTIALMNCTFNCLIFYWKNKILRREGMKVLKSMEICRWIRRRPSDHVELDDETTH